VTHPTARPTPYLVAFEQCGVELMAPHLLTTTKRRIETADVDVATLPDDSLRFTGWAPERIEARFPGLTSDAAYVLEAGFVCERDVERVVRLTAGGVALRAPIELDRGTATVVHVAIPPEATVSGTLDVAVERVRGPDVVLSELRLFSSEPPPPTLTVVGDTRGGLIGTVATPDSRGVPGTTVAIAGDAGAFEVGTDAWGWFRVPLDRLGRGRDGTIRVATGAGPQAAEISIDSRHLARGLRELPPPADRLDLAGAWRYHGGPCPGRAASETDTAPARVPGHVIYDGLVPEGGVGTLHRRFELPAAWAGRAVFLRCDGAYGRADIRVNGMPAGVHGSGATSFDVDLTPYVRPGENELAVTLTEYTPHSVLDDMSWYAHMSLLGIWRDVFLFATPMVQLGQLDLDADWDPQAGRGTLAVRAQAINLDPADRRCQLELVLRADDGTELLRARRRAVAPAGAAVTEVVASEPLAVSPWSAEEPRLYDLEVTLGADGAGPQTVHRRIGFRRVEVRGDQLLVNGSPIRVRGVNRHDSRLLKGRALSADDMREDIRNLRRANVNVIRTSHYPPSPHLLDACDELGMYVLEQPPICFSGGFDDHHWTRTNEAMQLAPYVLEVTAETVSRDRGRCSVIVWDLGNESRWGPAFDAQLALVRSMDPTRPTIFSFDLNELGPENELVTKPVAERPELRSYHYPGWDRTWQEDLAWLGSYDQPVVLDEYVPVFAPCLRGPGEGYGLAIDPGIRDYWGSGYRPFVEAALGEHGVLGGLIWGGFGEVFAIPLDLTIGQGPWAHLPVADYVRTRDQYPAEPGVFRRGDGDWGIFDAWNRPRPELWHVHEMYAPIAVAAAVFDDRGRSLEVELSNRFTHRSFAGLEVRVTGGKLEGSPELASHPGPSADPPVRPGQSARLAVRRADETDETDGEDEVRVEVWHPEGWLIAGWAWPWPGAATPADAVLAGADGLALDLGEPGSLSITSRGQRWLRGWPALHVLDVDMPHVPVACGQTDGGEIEVLGPEHARAPIASRDWQGWVTARVEGRTAVFEYDVTYLGARPVNAKEVGLTFRPDRALSDLWWHRVGDWSLYPPDHIGRTAGYAPGVPGSNTTLSPAPTWAQDATAAGSNDYRSVKRSINVGGATDGQRSLTVLSSEGQHLRAELVDGLPELHVLDWYGGVRTLEGNHPIWSAYFGSGMAISPGTRLQGRVVIAAGDLPPSEHPGAGAPVRAPRSRRP
jgi:beta-galactosidase